MFRAFKEIDSAFRYIRSFSLVFLLSTAGISCFTIARCLSWISQERQKVWVLANGRAMEALASDRKDNLPVEARDHVRNFHQDFFNLDPDEKVISAQIGRALWLADGSAKSEYDNLRESGYYSNLIAGNISQQVEIDSIDLDVEAYPYRFRCYGKEKLVRSTSLCTRSLITQGLLRNVARSDNNPHGFLIEQWMILENKDLSVEKR
jgi:conjugative transposon TraK protein